jgi:preprotein translocase subunit SecB
MKLSFDTSGVFDKENSTYELVFVTKVFNGEAIENAFLNIRCNGIFKFESVKTFEEIPDFFYRNSIAILFPYVRAYVSLITTQANVKGIILPTLNLSHLEEDLRKNTTQK